MICTSFLRLPISIGTRSLTPGPSSLRARFTFIQTDARKTRNIVGFQIVSQQRTGLLHVQHLYRLCCAFCRACPQLERVLSVSSSLPCFLYTYIYARRNRHIKYRYTKSTAKTQALTQYVPLLDKPVYLYLCPFKYKSQRRHRRDTLLFWTGPNALNIYNGPVQKRNVLRQCLSVYYLTYAFCISIFNVSVPTVPACTKIIAKTQTHSLLLPDADYISISCTLSTPYLLCFSQPPKMYLIHLRMQLAIL